MQHRRKPWVKSEKLTSPSGAKDPSVLVENQHSRSNDGAPQPTLIPNRRLSDVRRTNDLIRNPINLFLLVPRAVRIELHVERRSQHLRRELLGILARRVVRLAKRMVLAEVTVSVAVSRNGHANTGRKQAMGLASRVLSYDRENHLARAQILQPLRARHQLALWWENR